MGVLVEVGISVSVAVLVRVGVGLGVCVAVAVGGGKEIVGVIVCVEIDSAFATSLAAIETATPVSDAAVEHPATIMTTRIMNRAFNQLKRGSVRVCSIVRIELFAIRKFISEGALVEINIG